jgi:hypothetical protein
MEMHTTEYKPLTGSTHFPVPKSISNSKAVINIHNNDYKCFAHAILAGIHPTEKHPERVSKYLPYEHQLYAFPWQLPSSNATQNLCAGTRQTI